MKSDTVARRATQNAAHIMFRLHTIYHPGGTNERDLISGCRSKLVEVVGSLASSLFGVRDGSP